MELAADEIQLSDRCCFEVMVSFRRHSRRQFRRESVNVPSALVDLLSNDRGASRHCETLFNSIPQSLDFLLKSALKVAREGRHEALGLIVETRRRHVCASTNSLCA